MNGPARSKRRRRDIEVEMGDVEEDSGVGGETVAEDGIMQVSGQSPKFRPGQRGGVIFNEDGTLSTVSNHLTIVDLRVPY